MLKHYLVFPQQGLISLSLNNEKLSDLLLTANYRSEDGQWPTSSKMALLITKTEF